VNEFEHNYLISRLDLDRERLERVAHRTHQWGEAVANLIEQRLASEAPADSGELPTLETLHSEAGSLFAIAGSYRMLLGHGIARESMLPAAQHLAAERSTFSLLCAICGGEPGIAHESLYDLPAALLPGERSDVLLAAGWIDVTGDRFSRDIASSVRQMFHQHLELARPAAEATVGRARIPLGTVAQAVGAAEELAHAEGEMEGPMERLRLTLHDALTRMHEVTAAAMADRYHWKRLMSSVLPVEPEAVVLSAVAMAAATRADVAGELIERIDLPPLAQISMQLGAELAEREQ
jgi:hypothetical protein